MDSPMKTLLSIVLVFLLFVGSLGYVAKRLQNPEFLVAQAREVNVYGRLSEKLGTTLPEGFIEGYPLTPEELTSVITTTIDADTFYDFLQVYAGSYVTYLSGKSETLNIQYNLTEIKGRLVESLATKLSAKYQNLPTCTAEQTRNWDIKEEFPSCKLPPGSVKDSSIDSQLKSQLTEQVNQLPDEVNVNQTPDDKNGVRNIIMVANTVINIVWIATLLLILLMLLVFRRKAFIPLGISLLFVGIVQVGFSLVAWDWIAQNIGDSIAGYGSSELTPLALDMVAVLLDVLKRTLGNLTIMILGAGGALLVLGIVAAVKGNKVVAAP